MVKSILKHLKETWGYTTEELEDIRENLEELAQSSYQLGYDDCLKNSEKVFTSYGKREDYE